MASVNKVILIGNITRSPEIKYTPKGTAVCDVGLAINHVRKCEGGEKIEDTTFVDVTLWGKTAEVANQYAKKGSPLYVEGRLTLESWEDKQSGQKRSKLKVVGESIQFLGFGKREEGEQAPARGQRPTPEPEDDDIPF